MMTIKYDPNFISPYEHLDLPHAPIIFPGIKPGEFNFAAEWVVVGYNLSEGPKKTGNFSLLTGILRKN